MKIIFACLPLFVFGLGLARAQQPDMVIADFEGETYGGWQATGEAFGGGPAQGTLKGQMKVDGFAGKGLVNSFNGGDDTMGTLASPEFKVERKFISFLIGGGGFEGKTCLNLMIDGKVARTATGPNTEPGGSERLEPGGWNVAEFAGKTARLVIVDEAKGSWGHINVDQITQTDTEPPVLVRLVANMTREITAEKRWLHFPMKNGAKKRVVTVSLDGKAERRFDIELADGTGEPDWWAPLDVSAWAGKKLAVSINQLPENSKVLDALRQEDKFLGSDNLYKEALRPQLQFSAKRGWVNDPNGLVFYNGEYHLFFQHNPYGIEWGNMHWGHATSRDLVHWEEHGEALYPDDMGPMFSGSAVVDTNNTSGLGKDGKAPLVLIYTAAGNPSVQGIAYSLDGRTFTKYADNPVLKQITGGNRDPKVMWHEPTKRWVMVLYVELPAAEGGPKPNHTIHFFTSPNLKDWTLKSVTPGFFECPDFFELPVDGKSDNKKWVLTGASSEYQVGTFDGTKFTPETPKLPGHRGHGFYAAQTFSDVPDGRRMQIGWGQCPSPGMPFNQLQTFPCELKLLSTPEGLRLAWQPIKQALASLHEVTHDWTLHLDSSTLTLGPDKSLPSPPENKKAKGELMEIRATFMPEASSEVIFKVRGIEVRYEAGKQEISIGDHRAPAPLRSGFQSLIILVDRTNVTVWASDGLTYIPFPIIAKPEDLNFEVSVKGGNAEFTYLTASVLKPIWP